MAKTIALAGNPNCGKTTLFNDLTGSNQYVGNWAGVTVEKKEGRVRYKGYDLTIVDLPGIYSLSPYTMEEVVARNFIVDEHPAAILNIVDGTNIERNLYLTLQLMELGVPVVVAINMMDDVEARGDSINITRLSSILGVPIIPISARSGDNIPALLQAVLKAASGLYRYKRRVFYNDVTEIHLGMIRDILKKYVPYDTTHTDFYASKLLEADKKIMEQLKLSKAARDKLEQTLLSYESTSKYGNRETMLADARYQYIEKLVASTVVKKIKPGGLTVSDKIDRIVTHKLLAIPMFLFIMFCMFTLVFSTVGSFLKGLMEQGVKLVSTQAAQFLVSTGAPDWTRGLLADAVIGGMGGILTFLPQIMLLFFCLSLMEDSGYMARAAFIMDKLLRKIGLSGKAFIPMLMGFGCTAPAVMAARTMENEKDRRMTILLIPFMSCGARLPIYGLFAGTFFAKRQGLVVFSLYLLGMVMAVMCGKLLKSTLFKGNKSTFVMELPPYRLPSFQTILLHMWEKGKGFLVKAGTIIFSMTVVIWLLQNFDFQLHMTQDTESSILGYIGRLIAPGFAPLGFGTWQAAVSLITGLVAKEAVVSTMTILYEVNGMTIASALSSAFTPVTAYAFMVFTLLYIPCISAFATIRRELNSAKWTAFSVLMQLTVAYICSFLVNRIGERLF